VSTFTLALSRSCSARLGGKDNFAADRAAAEQVMQVMPEILDTVRGNRQFLVRAVPFLRDAGIRQFIDIGSGLPSSPNVHEIAQAAGARAGQLPGRLACH
jgi:S-adenosyl methyltransferase